MVSVPAFLTTPSPAPDPPKSPRPFYHRRPVPGGFRRTGGSPTTSTSLPSCHRSPGVSAEEGIRIAAAAAQQGSARSPCHQPRSAAPNAPGTRPRRSRAPHLPQVEALREAGRTGTAAERRSRADLRQRLAPWATPGEQALAVRPGRLLARRPAAMPPLPSPSGGGPGTGRPPSPPCSVQSGRVGRCTQATPAMERA